MLPQLCYDKPIKKKSTGEIFWAKEQTNDTLGIQIQKYKGSNPASPYGKPVDTESQYRIITQTKPFYVLSGSTDLIEIQGTFERLGQVYACRDHLLWAITASLYLHQLSQQGFHKDNYEVLKAQATEIAESCDSVERLLIFYDATKAIPDNQVTNAKTMTAHVIPHLQLRLFTLFNAYLDKWAKSVDELQAVQDRVVLAKQMIATKLEDAGITTEQKQQLQTEIGYINIALTLLASRKEAISSEKSTPASAESVLAKLGLGSVDAPIPSTTSVPLEEPNSEEEDVPQPEGSGNQLPLQVQSKPPVSPFVAFFRALLPKSQKVVSKAKGSSQVLL